jgi:aspartyl-tRNA(Asn)/glutamyl-tRNA(Gln) amidotransferase subunit A
MNFRSLAEVQNAWNTGKITIEQLVDHYLLNISTSNPTINAFLEVFSHEAIEKAKELDLKKRENKPLGKLAGMVIAIKDNICFAGHKVSASSKILEGYTSVYSATAIERLIAEDVIIIGRTNCDEFAMGSSNENSFFGTVKNPIDNSRVPGGSSGGSIAAVAANMCLASLGSDTGGSIRQPASFCGLVGLKPTYGRISRYGLLAYGSSFDQIGPVTHSLEDAGLLLQVMAGKDPLDATSSSVKVDAYGELKKITGKKKIAVLDVVIDNPAIQPAVMEAYKRTIKKLEDEGNEIVTVKFPYLDFLVPIYYVLTTAEASSNLSRYDGIHYGYRSETATDLESTYLKSRSEGFGKEVKRRIMLGTFVLSAGYYDAYYTKAQKVRRLVKEATDEIFKTADFIFMPSTPGTAFKFGQKSNDPITMYLEDLFTVQANITGHPSISVPVGIDHEGLPVGMQLMAPAFSEHSMLEMASTIITY